MQWCIPVHSFCSYIKRADQANTMITKSSQRNKDSANVNQPEGPPTKDVAHLRRSKGIVGQPVNVAPEMLCRMKKEAFLANPQNKTAFIQLLGVQLNAIGITVHYARGDADLLIACTAIELAKENHVTAVDEDTDLIVLLLHHAPNSCQTIVLKSDIHRSIKSHKPAKQWHIHSAQRSLGSEMCRHLLFIHGLLGCDTTSSIYGLGKGMPLALKNASLCRRLFKEADIFLDPTANINDVQQARECAMAIVFGVKNRPSLNDLTYQLFCKKIARINKYVQPCTLPPTSAASKFHSEFIFKCNSGGKMKVSLLVNGGGKMLILS
ncbi:hypothetical protein CAPTEDRAFT_191939 [Capitella teleta]|uniref:Uncharacterized protein n=1 Tax=Capitella teleta TaxID=283909 RepID=R7T8F7_CAPTE|nr:hypothetical protein CAPTEDRAFT_191939 [Capitella teleta]|eukprot:ELT89964.1 hypothetical protein CAPTEDRAFT_191939 [Capitella teleta]